MQYYNRSMETIKLLDVKIDTSSESGLWTIAQKTIVGVIITSRENNFSVI